MKKLFLFLFISILLISCKQNVVSINHYFATSYEYGIFYNYFIPITDKDDIIKLKENFPKLLKMEDLGKNYSVELLMMRTGGLRKNKKVGINVFKIEVSNLEYSCFKTQSFIQCISLIYPSWYNSNFIDAIRTDVKQINNRRFLLVKRKLNLKQKNVYELIAFTLEKNNIFIFELYSNEKNFEKSTKTLLSILEYLNFEKSKIDTIFENNKLGFFTGLWHGGTWFLRWGFSWFHYYDVWPDNNTGSGYTIGFIIGLIVLGGLRSAGSE